MATSYKTASHRLQRQVWKPEDIQTLAQEVYAILQEEDVLNEGEETHESDGTKPSSRYRSYDFSESPAIRIEKVDRDTGRVVETMELTSAGISITTEDGEDTEQTGITVNGQPIGGEQSSEDITGDDVPTPIPYLGEIVSGSGATYQVRVWGLRPSANTYSTTVSATQQQIDSAETIPAGSKVFVLAYPYDYEDPATLETSRLVEWVLQVPVWL